ncbi:hypothetical protein GUITHDRAFT_151749 [Guillardia theta CCMP2712]|uniref:Uncharacterized protein n=1 Tax=Guillardia theta (strain CCMP2712) TaxID=905079 RepID=L1JJW9_GUITC|nr:hypothetical protein GUITHDRAFT_151749 [Guillardia theta CCMP2712]EKX48444.1 hypothetical protein GUITHDRAFT_151749 [Guillardia theta CCMP2712]|eukprot:XP_005835424.1 hypothetical protein GUITHDRAFT_151749 [Guillardia theta CCMP2712]
MLFQIAPTQKLAYGFVSGVFGCAATGNTDEDMGAVTICPDAPMTNNGPRIDWLAPQFQGDSGAYAAPVAIL